MSGLEKQSPAPIVFSGPSAVGKTYLVKYLSEQYEAERLIATTTRQMRPGEVNLVDSHFLSEEEFTAQEASGELFLCSGFLGARYAFKRGFLDGIRQRNSVPLVEIYSPKITNFLGAMPASRTVFLRPPSLDYLEQRMIQRGQAPEEVEYRMRKVREEMDYFDEEGQQYYENVYVFTPDTFDDTVAAIAETTQLIPRPGSQDEQST